MHPVGRERPAPPCGLCLFRFLRRLRFAAAPSARIAPPSPGGGSDGASSSRGSPLSFWRCAPPLRPPSLRPASLRPASLRDGSATRIRLFGAPFSRPLHGRYAPPLEYDENGGFELDAGRVQGSEKEPRFAHGLAIGVGSIDDAVGPALEERLEVMGEEDRKGGSLEAAFACASSSPSASRSDATKAGLVFMRAAHSGRIWRSRSNRARPSTIFTEEPDPSILRNSSVRREGLAAPSKAESRLSAILSLSGIRKPAVAAYLTHRIIRTASSLKWS